MKKSHLNIKFNYAFNFNDQKVYEYVVHAHFTRRNETHRRFKKRYINEVRRCINEIPSHIIPDLATSRLYVLVDTQLPIEYTYEFNKNTPFFIRRELYRRLRKLSVGKSVLSSARKLKLRKMQVQEPELTDLIMQRIKVKDE